MTALEGVRVLDLSRLLPGPYATMFLADFGAEVIKVEMPGEGDYARTYWPLKNSMGYRFIILNRNKKSMTLNLKSDEGKLIFRRLAEKADIVIESFRPGVMKKLGLDYEALSAVNPRLIMCSLSGFGQNGPYKDCAGHDLNYISIAGIASLTGVRGGAPVIPGIQVADLTGGLMAAMAMLIALQARERTGKGQYIDASLFGAAMATLPADASVYFGSGKIPKRGETRLTGGWPNYAIYKTSDDRYMACGALEKKFWTNFCRVIGKEYLTDKIDDDSKWPEIEQELQEIFKSKSFDEWNALLDGKDTCVTPVLNLDETFADRHVLENGFVLEADDERFGKYMQLGTPFKLSETPGSLRTPAPELGEHTAEILRELGVSDKDISDYSRNGVI